MERLEMDVLMIRINGLMGAGRYAEARGLLERVLDAEPGHGVAHGMMGWICWALLDDHERAVVHFRCAVRWAPGHAASWLHYLRLLAGDGHGQELHEAYQRALQVPGIDRCAVLSVVAGHLERTGRPAEALRLYRSARSTAMTAAEEADQAANIRRVSSRLRRARWAGLFG